MKRVALLFVGRIYTWEHCYPTFKKHMIEALDGWEIDGFLCHNSENDLSVTCHPSCKHCKELDETSPSRLDDFCKKYFIKRFANEYHDISVYTQFEPHRIGPIRMHYCWQKGFELIEGMGVNYDLVIYLRADQHFYQDLQLPEFPLRDDTLYIPEGNDHTGVNDQFAMGSMKAMKHYTSSFSHMMDIYKETGIPFHTETYVKLHNQKMNIVRFPLHYALQRGRNEKEAF